jgi:hypothetical protein
MGEDAHALKQAVESEYGGAARLIRVVPVREIRRGEPIWQATVHVFDLTGHATCDRAYAWSTRSHVGNGLVFHSVLRVEAES